MPRRDARAGPRFHVPGAAPATWAVPETLPFSAAPSHDEMYAAARDRALHAELVERQLRGDGQHKAGALISNSSSEPLYER